MQLGFRAAVADDAAVVDDDRAVADCIDLLENVGRDDDGLRIAHGADQLAHLVLLVEIETVGRLVQDQDVRIVQDCLSQT